MIERIEINNLLVASKLLSLQKSSYQVEAELIGFHEIPPLIESIEELIDSKEDFWVWKNAQNYIGCIALEEQESNLIISRLFVSPLHFKNNIGASLVNKAIDIAKEKRKVKLLVSTGSKNYPAINLYKKFGFTLFKEEVKATNLHVSHFNLQIE